LGRSGVHTLPFQPLRGQALLSARTLPEQTSQETAAFLPLRGLDRRGGGLSNRRGRIAKRLLWSLCGAGKGHRPTIRAKSTLPAQIRIGKTVRRRGIALQDLRNRFEEISHGHAS
jgi:hypothetical protein